MIETARFGCCRGAWRKNLPSARAVAAAPEPGGQQLRAGVLMVRTANCRAHVERA
jgi:hypothetical protein